MEIKELIKQLTLAVPMLLIYIAGMKLEIFPRLQNAIADMLLVFLQLLAIGVLLRLYLDFYATYLFMIHT